jgi:Kef-type K+ transport system membrane component KefB
MTDAFAFPQRLWRLAGTYALLVGLPVLLVIGALAVGEQLPAATGVAPTRTHGPAGTGSFDLALLTLQIVVIVSVARLAGAAVARIGQPRVIGEILGGLLLGPSLFGRFAPELSAALFPPSSLGFINALAQFGLLFFMFLVGMELDPTPLRRRAHVAVVTSHASITAPFLLGVLLSLALYTRFAPTGVGFTPFALFMGAAMSVTAFPVLARILSDRGLTGTPLGALAIACAAVDDVTAWCILAAVVLVAKAGSIGTLAFTLAGTVAYVIAMFTIGRQLLRWLAERASRTTGTEGFFAGALLITLASAWVTERLGIHGVLGAFLVGALMPRDTAMVGKLTERLHTVMVVLLLPLFFVFTGLRTTLTLISGGTLWWICAAVIFVAVAGKLGGSALAARATGMAWRDAWSLGALMNTRGLMELVILNVGLDIGVLSPTLFAMMVLMALVTTAMTTPLVDALRRGLPNVAGAA